MFYARADKSSFITFQGILLFAIVVCIAVLGWNDNVYGEKSPGFIWTMDVVYPVQDDSIAATTKTATGRNAMFEEIVTNLSAGGSDTHVEKFQSSKGIVYRIKSLTKTSLANFRRQLHTEITKKVSLLSGPVRMSISGKVAAAGTLTVVVDSNPSTGYHWTLDSSSGAQVVFTQTKFERRALKYGAPESQKLFFNTHQKGDAQIELVYKRPWRRQDEEIIQLKLETDDPLPGIVDLSDPFAVRETMPGLSSEELQGSVTPLREATSLPASFDWRTKGVVPDIRNQGSCGSCWAFGTVGVMESALRISGAPMTDLSEQFLVSCNKHGWNCDGGWTAHMYHYNTLGRNQPLIGAVLETDMAYTATDGTCTTVDNHPYILSGWTFVTSSELTVASVDQIKTAIYNYGPITAGVCVGSAFDYYESGVFSTDEDCGGSTNHQIILVGWNDNGGNGYWILRNSWDSDWGESGYMRIKYGTSRVGEGTSYVTTACLYAPVKISGTSNYYNRVQTAYNAASSGQTILMRNRSFTENLSLTEAVAVTLKGGYICNYSAIPGFTTINGKVTISGTGSVTMNQIIIK